MTAQARKPLVFADDGLPQQLQAGDSLDERLVKLNALATSGAHIAVDLSLGVGFSHTTSENTQLDNPSNMPASGYAQSWVVVFTQGATPYALALGSYYAPANGYFSLTQAAGAVDTLHCLAVGPSLVKCWMSS